MFQHINEVPGDAILGLMEAFNQDTRSEKVDLGVGVYRDATGQTPVLRAVKEAESLLVRTEASKSYLNAHGVPGLGDRLLREVFGAESLAVDAGRAGVTQSAGGTGGLRLAGDLIRQQFPGSTLWLSNPTWPNHQGVFAAAGVPMRDYPYVDADNRLDFAAMLDAVKQIPAGDVLLLHGSCHNPTGFDLSPTQWQSLVDVIAERSLLPLVDLAYQGFGDGLDDDALGVRLLASQVPAMLVTASCSKNFGLYRERIGALIVVAPDPEQLRCVRSQLAVIARGNYSTPPSHGGAVVAEVLGSPELTALWKQELTDMRERINGVRRQLVDALAVHGLEERFACIAEQRGMFSYTGLQAAEVDRLQREYGIYMVRSGRANVAGLNADNIEYVAGAIAAVCG